MSPHRRVSAASGTLNRSHMCVKTTTYVPARVSTRIEFPYVRCQLQTLVRQRTSRHTHRCAEPICHQHLLRRRFVPEGVSEAALLLQGGPIVLLEPVEIDLSQRAGRAGPSL